MLPTWGRERGALAVHLADRGAAPGRGAGGRWRLAFKPQDRFRVQGGGAGFGEDCAILPPLD